jgi:hypothetical protein
MANRILATEYVVALGISSYAAIKDGQAPWPPTVIRTSIAFGILGMVAMMNERFAYVLAGGFLLAQLLKVYETGTPFTGGAPENQTGTVTGDKTSAQGIALGELKLSNGKTTHPGILSFRPKTG